ncbi:MAG: acetolactate synthase 2 catalytic subunit [Robiginitomaculum sp.]|nr:MAG: acetolactate synthase 2 catalytic subunit [Robiginitomaculum sp.]
MNAIPSTLSPETPPKKNLTPTGAELVVTALRGEGVDTVFGYPGGAIMPLYDALPGSGLKHILVRHEQAAAFSADAYARATGKAGVCFATSGPGATNLLTGIANAFMDSVPLIAITGQVPTTVLGTDAFQEIDIFGMALPVVKHSFLVRRAEDIPHIIAEAFEIATSGRPGPVLIDLPKDVAQARVAETKPVTVKRAVKRAPDPVAIANAETLLKRAKRPVLYIGGGVVKAKAGAALRRFNMLAGIPAVSTLTGLGVLPTDNADFYGMLGMHGSKEANILVQEADLLLVCGARFDDRATGKLDTFAPGAKVIHLDCDPAEIGKLRDADAGVKGDLKASLESLAVGILDISLWRARAQKLRAQHKFNYSDAPGAGIFAPAFLEELSRTAGERFVATCDVGQHQMWVAQHCHFTRPEAHLTSGGLGAMGYGIPAGIGAKLARPDDCVVTITGDGSIMMNIQELATIRRYGVALKIVLFDNSTLGLVRQWQELFFDGNYSEVDLYDNPDFADVARAFGIEAFTVSRREQTSAAIKRLLGTNGPVLAHVRIDPRENVWPLVPPGKSNAEMMERKL